MSIFPSGSLTYETKHKVCSCSKAIHAYDLELSKICML